MGLIVDTNALSAMADSRPGITAALSSARFVAIPVIVLGEYRFGIAQSRRSAEYEEWLGVNLRLCRVLEITEETSRLYAALRAELKKVGKPIPSNDVWIAALCRQHQLPILSSDGHFDAVRGLKRVGW